MKLLFICSRNRLRSPTAEHVFGKIEGIETDSAGVAPDAENPVTAEAIEWADLIFVMEPAHRSKLNKFSLRGKRVVCLNIPDKYDFMDPELIDLLREPYQTLLWKTIIVFSNPHQESVQFPKNYELQVIPFRIHRNEYYFPFIHYKVYQCIKVKIWASANKFL